MDAGWIVDVLHRRGDGIGCLERKLSGEHLVEDYTQRVQVAALLEAPQARAARGAEIKRTEHLTSWVAAFGVELAPVLVRVAGAKLPHVAA